MTRYECPTCKTIHDKEKDECNYCGADGDAFVEIEEGDKNEEEVN